MPQVAGGHGGRLKRQKPKEHADCLRAMIRGAARDDLGWEHQASEQLSVLASCCTAQTQESV